MGFTPRRASVRFFAGEEFSAMHAVDEETSDVHRTLDPFGPDCEYREKTL
jgi:hypothetical protein